MCKFIFVRWLSRFYTAIQKCRKRKKYQTIDPLVDGRLHWIWTASDQKKEEMEEGWLVLLSIRSPRMLCPTPIYWWFYRSPWIQNLPLLIHAKVPPPPPSTQLSSCGLSVASFLRCIQKSKRVVIKFFPFHSIPVPRPIHIYPRGIVYLQINERSVHSLNGFCNLKSIRVAEGRRDSMPHWVSESIMTW